MELIIDNGYFKEPECVNGFIEAYRDFPWVYTDEEGLKRELIDRVIMYYTVDDNGNPIQNSRYGLYDFTYINPSHIVSIHEAITYDIESTEYYYSEITLDNNDVYYIADWLSAVYKKREEHDG